MTNNYPRPQLKPGQQRIKDEDISQTVPGDPTFEVPGGAGGQFNYYHKDYRDQARRMKSQKSHKTRKEKRYQNNLINREVSKVDEAFANIIKISAHPGQIR